MKQYKTHPSKHITHQIRLHNVQAIYSIKNHNKSIIYRDQSHPLRQIEVARSGSSPAPFIITISTVNTKKATNRESGCLRRYIPTMLHTKQSRAIKVHLASDILVVLLSKDTNRASKGNYRLKLYVIMPLVCIASTHFRVAKILSSKGHQYSSGVSYN